MAGKRVRIPALLAILGTLALVAPESSGAEEGLEVLVTEYPPFMGESGTKSLWCELVEAAFARVGISATFVSRPLERIKSDVAYGIMPVFLNSTLVISPEEAPKLLVGERPMIYAEIVLFYPVSAFPKGFTLHSPAELAGRRVGALRGTGSVTRLTAAGAAFELSNDLDSLFLKLDKGRLEMVAVADITGLETMRRVLPDSGESYRYTTFYKSPIDLVFSRLHPRGPALQAGFSAGLARIKADGTYLSIVSRYYPAGRLNTGILPVDLR